MDFEDNQSSSSSASSPVEIVTPPNYYPKTLTPTSSTPFNYHKKRAAGRKIFKETRHPVYRGVRRRNGSKWVCEVREPHKKTRIWLGTFPSPETAAVAHDVAVLALRGEKAPLNFPGSAGFLPRPDSSSHQDIQRAAFQAARDFGPVSTPSSSSSFGFSPCRHKVSGSSLPTSGQSRVSEIESITCNHGPERVSVSGNSGQVGFVDEEAMFNMPVLLDSMAEGMLLTPLAMKKGFNWSTHEVDDDIELTLWGY